MSIIKCIYWLVGSDVILMNKTVKHIQSKPQQFSETFGQGGYSNASP